MLQHADLALGPAAEERGLEEAATRNPVPPTYVGAANDLVIIQGVSQFPTSIGFVGLAYADGRFNSYRRSLACLGVLGCGVRDN